jgi:predicted nucleic acid-binding protein
VDTCIWSLALRRTDRFQNPEVLELRRLITAHLVEIVGPIRQELLSGVRNQLQFNRLETHLSAFADLPLQTEDYVEAAKFFNLCRAKGIQGSNADFLICAVAARRDLAIFTIDRDLFLFAKCLPVRLHEVKRAEV